MILLCVCQCTIWLCIVWYDTSYRLYVILFRDSFAYSFTVFIFSSLFLCGCCCFFLFSFVLLLLRFHWFDIGSSVCVSFAYKLNSEYFACVLFNLKFCIHDFQPNIIIFIIFIIGNRSVCREFCVKAVRFFLLVRCHSNICIVSYQIRISNTKIYTDLKVVVMVVLMVMMTIRFILFFIRNFHFLYLYSFRIFQSAYRKHCTRFDHIDSFCQHISFSHHFVQICECLFIRFYSISFVRLFLFENIIYCFHKIYTTFLSTVFVLKTKKKETNLKQNDNLCAWIWIQISFVLNLIPYLCFPNSPNIYHSSKHFQCFTKLFNCLKRLLFKYLTLGTFSSVFVVLFLFLFLCTITQYIKRSEL